MIYWPERGELRLQRFSLGLVQFLQLLLNHQHVTNTNTHRHPHPHPHTHNLRHWKILWYVSRWALIGDVWWNIMCHLTSSFFHVELSVPWGVLFPGMEPVWLLTPGDSLSWETMKQEKQSRLDSRFKIQDSRLFIVIYTRIMEAGYENPCVSGSLNRAIKEKYKKQ